MGNSGIPLDGAELLSVILESVLYGFSLLMFGGTMWALFAELSVRPANRIMFTVACAFLLFSTAHIVIHIIRIMEGLVLYRDTYPGGPNAFFANPAQWTFVAKSFVYVIQTLMGDGVVLYRCYAVWQNKLVMILPILLWCGVAVTGIASSYMTSQTSGIFAAQIFRWITATWAVMLTCNMSATLLLAGRIWYVDRNARKLRSHPRPELPPIVRVILDSGVIYSLSVFVGLVCYVSQTNGQYVILDMMTPIIAITFYMIIVRVGLTQRSYSSRSPTSIVFGSAFAGDSVPAEQQRTMQVHVHKLTEGTIDSDQHSPSYFASTTGGENSLGRLPVGV